MTVGVRSIAHHSSHGRKSLRGSSSALSLLALSSIQDAPTKRETRQDEVRVALTPLLTRRAKGTNGVITAPNLEPQRALVRLASGRDVTSSSERGHLAFLYLVWGLRLFLENSAQTYCEH